MGEDEKGRPSSTDMAETPVEIDTPNNQGSGNDDVPAGSKKAISNTAYTAGKILLPFPFLLFDST